jgi:para-nitrobenzyl esterase
MFWIHGGGNSMGSGSDYAMARNLAARHGVIVVTVNYRLGVLGWFHHPALHGADSSPEDRSGNYGTLDLIRGLEWVKENIAAFGGDSGNVTIFGESAGGMNVYSLLVSPKARGLFHRAIAQSGFPSSTPLTAARNLVDDAEPGITGSSNEVLVHLLVADGLAKDRAEAKARLAGMSAEETARYLHAKAPHELLSMFKGSTFGMYRSPDILRDGTVLPAEPFLQVMVDPARYNAVPAILGTNRDEAKLFMAANPRFVGKRLGLIPYVRDVAEYNRAATYMSDTWKVLGADLPATRMRAAQGPSVYVYRFEWDELPSRWPVDLGVLMGAAHAFEIPFVFHDLDTQLFGIGSKENRPGREVVAHAMSSYWAEFARTGSPGRGRAGDLPEWKPYEDSNLSADRLMIFDSPAGGGVRMSSLRMTPEDLTARVMRDAAFEGKPRERCLQFARMFNFVNATGYWSAEDFQRQSGSACQDFTPEQVRAAQTF